MRKNSAYSDLEPSKPLSRARRHKKVEGFTKTQNDYLNDPNFSFGAKGLHAYMKSKPWNWRFTETSISSQTKEGIKAIKRQLGELIDAGLVIRKKLPSGHMEYQLFEPAYEDVEVQAAQSQSHQKHLPKRLSAESQQSILAHHSNTIKKNQIEERGGNSTSSRELLCDAKHHNIEPPPAPGFFSNACSIEGFSLISSDIEKDVLEANMQVEVQRSADIEAWEDAAIVEEDSV